MFGSLFPAHAARIRVKDVDENYVCFMYRTVTSVLHRYICVEYSTSTMHGNQYPLPIAKLSLYGKTSKFCLIGQNSRKKFEISPSCCHCFCCCSTHTHIDRQLLLFVLFTIVAKLSAEHSPTSPLENSAVEIKAGLELEKKNYLLSFRVEKV